jgi:hypothetical protein
MIRILIPILLIAALASCSSESSTSTSPTSEPVLDGHTRMKNILDSIARHSNPLENYSMNSERAKHWEAQLGKAGNTQEWASLQFKVGLELLNAGKTESAIIALEKIINRIETELKMGLNQNTKAIYEMQALAYLRLGEQTNCIQQHNPCFLYHSTSTRRISQVYQGL